MATPSLNWNAGAANSVPGVPHDSIRRRESLWASLHEGLSRRVVVVQAGASHGKTTFLADFARAQQGSTGRGVAWLTLDTLHQDRIQLLEDLARALEEVQPPLGAVTREALRRHRDAPRRWGYLLDLLRRELHESEVRPVAIILDRYERVHPSPGIRETLDHLLRALPRGLPLVISSRGAPDLPSVELLRGEGEVVEILASDLLFTAEEAREVLFHHSGLPLSPRQMNDLMARTGGWPALIQMAASIFRQWGVRPLGAFLASLPQVHDFIDHEVF